MARMNKIRFLCVAVFLTALSTGCTSLTFDRDWNQAVTAGVKSEGLEGQWAGTWRSNTNGHNGSLRCIMTKVDGQTYRARFFARYFSELLAFEYTVDLKPQKRGDAIFFEGKANLGTAAGGIYTHKGHVKNDHYQSTYHASGDQGVYQLRRYP